MEKDALTSDLAEEILRENGYADEADRFLAGISNAHWEEAWGLIEALKQRALEVLSYERTQEQIDASWARMASWWDMSLEAERVKKI